MERLRVNCALAVHTLAIKQLYRFFLLYYTVQQYIETPGSQSKRIYTPLGLQVEARTSNHYQCKKQTKQLKIKVNGIVMEKQIQSNVKSRLFCREPASKFYHRARTCRKIDSTKTLPNISRSCSPKLHKEWPLNQLSAEAFLPLFRYAFLENRKSK